MINIKKTLVFIESMNIKSISDLYFYDQVLLYDSTCPYCPYVTATINCQDKRKNSV